MIPDKSKPKGKGLGPIFSLKVPNFRAMNQKYKKKLEELGYPTDQPQAVSISMLPDPQPEIKQETHRTNQMQDRARMTYQVQRKKQGKKEGKDQQGKIQVENPWIMEMKLRDTIFPGSPTQKTVTRPEENKARESLNIKDPETIQNEFPLEMFFVPDKREVRLLTRYDTWEKDLSPEEWVKKCKANPDQPHGVCPIYNGDTYIWQPVKVRGYDNSSNRYDVLVTGSGQEKQVTRLALMFFEEDRGLFNLRLKECKERRDIVENELRFQDCVDGVNPNSITNMPESFMKEIGQRILIQGLQSEEDIDQQHVQATTERLGAVVGAIYRRTMKKCIVLQNMLKGVGWDKLEDFRIPVKLSKRNVPYMAVVETGRERKKMLTTQKTEMDSLCLGTTREMMRVKSLCKLEDIKQMDRHSTKRIKEIKNILNKRDKKKASREEIMLSWQTGESPVGLLSADFQKVCEKFRKKTLFLTDTEKLILPLRSSEFWKIEKKQITIMSNDILNNWRLQILHDIRQRIKQASDICSKEDFEKTMVKREDDRYGMKKSLLFDISNKEEYQNSHAKTLIRKYDYAFKEHLGNFFMNSVKDLVNFMQLFTLPKEGELWKVSRIPLIKIDISYTGLDLKHGKKEVKKKDKKDKKKKKENKKEVEAKSVVVIFQPDLEKVRIRIDTLLDELVKVSSSVNILETEDFNVFLDAPKKPAYQLSLDTKEIVDAKKRIKVIVDECIKGPIELLNKFKKYEFLMTTHIQDIAKFINAEPAPSIEELRKKLEEYDRAGYEVQTLAIDDVQFTMFQVNTKIVKEYLTHRANKLKNCLLDLINKYCMRAISEIHTAYSDLQTKVEDKPTSHEGYKELKACVDGSNKKTQELGNKHENVKQHMEILEDHSFKIERELYKTFSTIYQYPNVVRTKIMKGRGNLSNYAEQIGADLERQKDTLEHDLNKYRTDFAEVMQFSDVDTAKNKYKAASELQKGIESLVVQGKKVNDLEELLEVNKKTEHSMLEKLDKDFRPFYTLIADSDNIQSSIDSWKNNSFNALKPQDIEEKINSWLAELDSLGKQLEDNKDQADVTIQLKGMVNDFRQHLDLIKCLRSEAIKEEELKEINDATELGLKSNDDSLSLNALIKKNAEHFMPEIKEIWERAEKKLELEKGQKKMKDEMSKKRLEVLKSQEGPTHIIKDYDTILDSIDEQISTTQNMLNSPYMSGNLRKTCILWSQKLQSLSEILEELKKCQRTWVYLQPMFAADDIRLQLKMEAEQFAEINEKWQAQMESLSTDNLVITLLEKDRLKDEFAKENEKLEAILRSLADFLEAKRKKFPRFYFISDADLLKILSKAKKDPLTVEPYLNKCFEGINTFEVTLPSQELIAIYSAQKEKIVLIRPLGLKEGDRKGNVDIWLKDLEKIMIDTLKVLCKKAVKDHSIAPHSKWILSWPAQLALLVSQIFWTASVEEALRGGRQKAMENYEETLKSQINEVVSLVRGDLNTINRLAMEAFLVIDNHAKDIVQKLIDNGVTDETSFDWISQLRVYQDKDDVKVKMVTASLKYGFEYLGNSSRLVITPLTDRCYRTLMTAKQMNRGGAPEGPAGAGKTETVKDLAKALGVYCVIFIGSEELDHMATAKFFKGIASVGAWCCFDEFNRIDLEVLSVIASQILMIQQALSTEQSVFHFTDEDVVLNPLCGINITMNPGQIGRTALPDNLKALFRPCVMTCPDYALIAEILLYSSGFHEARILGHKIVAALRLCFEQLSHQEHYDFGMRALHAILTTAGTLRKNFPNEKEEVLVRHALDGANLPKLTAQDIPFYLGIEADLFPEIAGNEAINESLKNELIEACKGEKLQPKEQFIKKCLQLYETLIVRHGVIVIGEAFSGKTQAIRILKKALTNMKDLDNKKYTNMIVRSLNPKAIAFKHLYGSFSEDSRTWTDGVLAILIREFTEMESPDMKWLVFDGPVDVAWMENMNTVLDDNKKLCLSSGSVIKLKSNLTMLFEVEELKHASSAIVSRCGMVYMETQRLGWEILIASYTESLPQILTQKKIKLIEEQMMAALKPAIAFLNKHCKFPIEMKIVHLVNNFLNIFESFVINCRAQTYKLSNDIDQAIPNCIIFSLIWSFGGVIDGSNRDRFHEFIQDLIAGKDIKIKHKLELESDYVPPKFSIKLLSDVNIFEQGYDRKKNSWYNLANNQQNVMTTFSKEAKYHEIIIPTIESMRMSNLLRLLVKTRKHLLMVGPTGTGKTLSIISELRASFSNQQYSYVTLCMSAQTTATQTQHIIESKLEKRGRKHQHGPAQGKKGIIFIDDLNMPQKDQFEAQPPLELLRQWMDYRGWYDIDSAEKKFKSIEDISFIGAMGPPSAGRQTISNRYLRHYNVLSVEHYDSKTLKGMYKSILEWSMGNATPNYPDFLIHLAEKLADATVETYLQLPKEQNLRPTPSKSHYTFNLRDIGKIFQGICRASAQTMKKEDDFIKLWAHECIRVFHDRLISQEDRDSFFKILKNKMLSHFNKEWENVVTVEPLLFGSFIQNSPLEERGEQTQDFYTELLDRQQLKATISSYLNKYNETQKNKLNIVLFMDATEHILKILRVITLPMGHCLLVGVGGSGRKSLTTLATTVGNFNLFTTKAQAEIKEGEWHTDLRALMVKTGVEKTPTVFFLTDAMILNETYLEDINNLLNIGEVPNLYSKYEKTEGKEDLILKLKEAMLAHNKKGVNNEEEVLEILKENSKENLHIVLSMNSMGEKLRQRFRVFPSIVNCTTIDWFLPWPQEALRSVALQSLNDLSGIDTVKEGIVSVCVDMQERVCKLTERYMKEMQCYYYVTPTSYLELLNIFKKLLDDKRHSIQTSLKSYETGLEELKKTESFVIEMKAKLSEMEPELKKKGDDALHHSELLKKKQLEVSEETKTVQKEEEKAVEAKSIADALQEECQKELDKAMPELKEAEKAMGTITPAAISILAKMDSPPEELKPVAKALCLILDIKPKPVPKSEPDYWVPKKIFTFKNIKKLADYDKENIPLPKITELKKITESPEFTSKKIESANAEGEMIARWIRALVKFDQINREVAPKKARLAEESAKAKEAQEVLTSKSNKLNQTKELFATCKKKSDDAEAQKKKLTQEIEETKKRSERANDLVNLLKDEKKRWNRLLIELQERDKNIVGDMLISSGIIAYLGIFPAAYRDACTDSWKELLAKLSIPRSDTFSLFNALCDPSSKLEWQKQKLPTDTISTDNAIIMDKSNRWPLLIDPQRIAADWIRRKETEKVETLKKTQDIEHIMARIASNLTSGTPTLFEDIGETIDNRLEPLLKREFHKEGDKTLIKFGENTVIVNKKPIFYMTTKLARPHYPPEICSIVTMLNFTATEEGLVDQMLNLIVLKEEPNTEKNREEAIKNSVAIKKTLKQNEEEILKLVTTNKEGILDSNNLIDKLGKTKIECKNSQTEVEKQRKNTEKNDLARSKFQSVAKRVAALYFCVADLAKVGPMYQYSLEWYKDIYQKALQSDVDPADKLESYKKKFTYLLFSNVCKSLFEKDKLLFTLNMLLTIFISEGINKPAEVQFLASGWCSIEKQIPPNPSMQKDKEPWLSDKAWRSICQLAQCFPAFKDLDKDFIDNNAAWEKVCSSHDIINSNKYPWPNSWSAPEKLNALQKLILINVLRPDEFVPAVLMMICENLGKEYLEFPALNLEEAYTSATHKTPILFILSPGADPMIELKAFAEKKKLIKGLAPMSLGKNQGKKHADLGITNLLKEKEEGWIVMQNCHFAVSYLPDLEKKLDEIPDEKLPFRIWLTSMPTPNFPVTLLQNAIKLTNEPPKGIVRGLLNNYSKLEASKFSDSNPKPQIWRKMLYNLCLFHAIVQERSKYGSLGWNNIYEFTQSDLLISIDNLEVFLKEYNEIPWEALNYMIAEANYGGRISDPFDSRCIKVILSDFLSPEVLKDNYRFCKRKEYALPPDLKTKEGYTNYIKNLPLIEDPEIFGLNEAANSACALEEANNILGSLLSLLPHTSMSSSQTPEQEVEQTVKKLFMDIPNQFDIGECTKKYPYTVTECMNTVLLQELVRYNGLLQVVKKSLVELQNAIKGVIIMTPEIEDVTKSILKNTVPEIWARNAYPSLKPLASWVKDLAARIKFFHEWLEKGVPKKMWISAFFNSQSFFTGVLQNYARKTHISFDSLIIEHEVLSESADLSYQTEGSTIYGLYIEGAKWSQEKKYIIEADMKIAQSLMPLIYLKPIEKKDQPSNRHTYECPVYKTTKRRGIVSSNGYSTNYMLSVDLPMAPDQVAKHWIKRGVAMVSQLND